MITTVTTTTTTTIVAGGQFFIGGSVAAITLIVLLIMREIVDTDKRDKIKIDETSIPMALMEFVNADKKDKIKRSFINTSGLVSLPLLFAFITIVAYKILLII